MQRCSQVQKIWHCWNEKLEMKEKMQREREAKAREKNRTKRKLLEETGTKRNQNSTVTSKLNGKTRL